MFDIKLDSQPEKFLERCDFILQKRIIKKLRELSVNPFLHDSKFLKNGGKIVRVRIGDYRILYEIDYDSKTIFIFKIDSQGSTPKHFLEKCLLRAKRGKVYGK